MRHNIESVQHAMEEVANKSDLGFKETIGRVNLLSGEIKNIEQSLQHIIDDAGPSNVRDQFNLIMDEFKETLEDIEGNVRLWRNSQFCRDFSIRSATYSFCRAINSEKDCEMILSHEGYKSSFVKSELLHLLHDPNTIPYISTTIRIMVPLVMGEFQVGDFLSLGRYTNFSNNIQQPEVGQKIFTKFDELTKDRKIFNIREENCEKHGNQLSFVCPRKKMNEGYCSSKHCRIFTKLMESPCNCARVALVIKCSTTAGTKLRVQSLEGLLLEEVTGKTYYNFTIDSEALIICNDIKNYIPPVNKYSKEITYLSQAQNLNLEIYNKYKNTGDDLILTAVSLTDLQAPDFSNVIDFLSKDYFLERIPSLSDIFNLSGYLDKLINWFHGLLYNLGLGILIIFASLVGLVLLYYILKALLKKFF